MASNQGHQSLKDKIVSHLPGRNKDANGNGVPDRLERNTGAMGGMNDLNRNGIPDSMERGYQQTTFVGAPTMVGGMTDLNRDGIPDQFQQQSTFTSGIVDVREAPTIIEKIEKPAVIHEVIKTEEVVQIQPVIEREREKLDVYEVVQPIREREVVATEVRSAVLPAQTRAAVVEDQSAFLAMRSAPGDISTREVAPTLHSTHQNAPIIHETITHRVIEEVQPVIYKEIERPILIKETLPIYERIVEAPHAHHSVLPVRDLGTRTVTSSTTTFVSGTDFNRNGIPDQLEGGMAYQTTGLQSGFTSGGVLPAQGFSNDLNRNGIPDSMERGMGYQQGLGLTGGLNDRNGNGIPDNLERPHRSLNDLNGNGIPDRMEKAHGLNDLNGNGIDDSLERRMGATSLNSTRL